MSINRTEIKVTGSVLKIARLRHEWFEFLDNPAAFVETLQLEKPVADVFTFLQEAHYARPSLGYHREAASASVLTFKTYKDWWTNLHFKVRNKVRKVQKTGVELRATQLDDVLVRGVKDIYDESPIRQGRKFPHYGKRFEVIREDLSSFPERTCFIGAYFGDELVGFMKLFEGHAIMRTVHIISKLAHRDKCVMDALIARAVEVCDQRKITHLHYGDWASRGLGVFRAKFGFEREDCPRYYVPLTARGKWMLTNGLHHPLKDRLPHNWVDRLVALRSRLYAVRYSAPEVSRE
jgi:hypothetical protein